MKKISEWLKELPPEIAERALKNWRDNAGIDEKAHCLSNAVDLAFIWSDTPEGSDFWASVASFPRAGIKQWPKIPGGKDITDEYELVGGVIRSKACEFKIDQAGRKDDSDKPRWDLLPLEQVEDIVKVLTFGAKKYRDWNWCEVENAEARYYAAAMRHLAARRKGEKLDSESGLPHLAHAGCCLLFLAWFDREKK